VILMYPAQRLEYESVSYIHQNYGGPLLVASLFCYNYPSGADYSPLHHSQRVTARPVATRRLYMVQGPQGEQGATARDSSR
jgi:hypothetical protein